MSAKTRLGMGWTQGANDRPWWSQAVGLGRAGPVPGSPARPTEAMVPTVPVTGKPARKFRPCRTLAGNARLKVHVRMLFSLTSPRHAP